MTREFAIGAPKIHFYDPRFRPCHFHENKLDDEHKYFLECDCPNSGYFTQTGARVEGRGYTGTKLDIVDCTNAQPTATSFINDPAMFG
jgi:hypothetical protein